MRAREAERTWLLALTLLGLVMSWLLLIVRPGPACAADSPRYAIRAGKIVTVTQGTVDGGLLLVSDGKIEAVGRADRVRVPPGYEVVDVGTHWVMPGMVEIHSHIGVQGGFNDMVSQLNPGMALGDGLDPESVYVKMALASGVTTIQTIPGSGTNHGGFGVLFKTAGATKEDRLVRRVGVMKMTQAYNPERPAGDIGHSRMGMTWLIRQHLAAAREYNEACSAHEEGQAPQPPARDLALEPARPVFRGEIPVLIHTYETWGVGTTMRLFGDEFGLKAIATHTEFGGFQIASEAARRGFAINVGPYVVDFWALEDGCFYSVVAGYHQAGVRELSVNTDAVGGWGTPTVLALKAALAARFGVDEETALKLVTINPARAVLMDRRLGSIEVGKDADLVVKASSLLDYATPVEMVFVNGRIAYRRAEEGQRRALSSQ